MTNKKKKYVNKKCFVVERAFGHSSALPTFGDADGDGVPNFYDCQPRNPYKDGILQDVGKAVTTRVRHEVGDIKERALEEIAGEKKRAERFEIEDVESEAYLKERKKAAIEDARRRARLNLERAEEEEKLRRTMRRDVVREEAAERREERRTAQYRARHSPRKSRESIYPRHVIGGSGGTGARKTEEHIPYTRRRIYT